MKKLLIILCIVLLASSHQGNAQAVSAFSVGWNIAHTVKPLSNLNNYLYLFNQGSPGLAKPYTMSDYLQGLYIDWRFGSPKGGMILGWQNKHVVAKEEGIATGEGETEYSIHRIKVRLNIVSWGYYFSLYKRIKMGITLDFGSFKVLEKKGTEASFDNAGYETFYEKKGTGAYGMTASISAPIPFSQHFQMRFQPYFQYVVLPFPMTVLDNNSIQSKRYFNPSNFGISVFFSFIGGK
jgi:hypothetical protein